MRHLDVQSLDSTRTYWVPSVAAPMRDWAGSPGCRRGARFLIEEETCRPARDNYPVFETRGACLQWIMGHRIELTRTAPGATVAPVQLDKWLLGLA